MPSPARARLAYALALTSFALVLLALVLAPAQDRQPVLQFLIGRGGNALFTVACAIVGLLILKHRPGNVIGRIYMAVSLSFALGEFAGTYTTRAQATTPSLPGAVWAAWLVDLTWYAAVPIGAILLLLLFPTGQPPSWRWRPVTCIAAIATVLATVGTALLPSALHKSYPGARNPLGIEQATSALELAVALGSVLLVGCLIASAGSLIMRWRRARGIERQQLKWLAYAGILVLLVELASQLVPHLLFQAAILVAALGLPVATGIAILRYRLYDIDRVINRTLVYGLLTALLVGVYAVGVTTLGSLFSPAGDSSLAVAASTLAVAALFQPARRRLQELVDRRFNRRRYDAARTMAAFSTRLRQQIDLDTLTAELLVVVDQTMQPTQASLWLRPSEASGAADLSANRRSSAT
jgi:hypothetical protein